jgi:hypothetical protein
MSFGALLEPRLSTNSSLGCSPRASYLKRRCFRGSRSYFCFGFVIGVDALYGVGTWRGLLISPCTIFLFNEMTCKSPALFEKKIDKHVRSRKRLRASPIVLKK